MLHENIFLYEISNLQTLKVFFLINGAIPYFCKYRNRYFHCYTVHVVEFTQLIH